MKSIKFLFLIVLSLFLITFCVVNRKFISLDLFPFPYSVELPVFLLLLISMAFGIAFTGLILNIQLFRMKHIVKNTKQRMQAVENENKTLRSERELALPAIADK